MGNICSKSANKDANFSTPGRVLGSSSNTAPPANARASVPQKVTTSSPGRALGSSDGTRGPEDPKTAAAKAAEERANNANKTGGRLSTQLAAQKKQTQNQTLNAGSEQERLARTADENAQTRNWN